MIKQGIITISILMLWMVSSVYGQDEQSAFKESYAAESLGKYDDAIEVLDKVYSTESYEINLRLGWLHYKTKDYPASVTYYKRCIQIHPLSIEAQLGYISPAAALGHWDDVLQAYKSILEIDPMHSYANYQLGLMYYYRKDYQEADKLVSKVANLYPFDYDSLLLLGWIKFKLGKTSEALVLFNKVLLYDPYDSSAKEGLEMLK